MKMTLELFCMCDVITLSVLWYLLLSTMFSKGWVHLCLLLAFFPPLKISHGMNFVNIQS